jgi:hypothetical protein
MPPLIDRNVFRAGVWGNAPLVERGFDPSIAVMLDEQFTSYDAAATTGDYVLTQATSGTAVISTTVPGALFVDAGAATDNQGVNLQRTKTAFVPAAGKDIWGEFSVILTATTPPITRGQIFIGLSSIDTTIIAAGANSSINYIGWDILDGELLVSKFSCCKASAAARATGPTFVDATLIRLGFRVSGVTSVQQYVNRVATGALVATANIPIVALYPSIVVQADGTDRPNMHISYKILQLR